MCISYVFALRYCTTMPCFAVVVATSFASAIQSYSADGFGANFVLKLLRRHPFEGFVNAFGIVLASKVENKNKKYKTNFVAKFVSFLSPFVATRLHILGKHEATNLRRSA